MCSVLSGVRLAALWVLPLSAAVPSFFAAMDQDAAIGRLLQAADAPRRVLAEGVIRMSVTIEETEGDTTASHLDVFVQGGDRALCVFRDGPLAQRRILLAEGKTWLIVPDTKRAIPITAAQRLLGGASIADVASLWFTDTYTAILREKTETIDGVVTRVLDLEALTRKATYPAGTLWIGAEDELPRKAAFRLASGKPAKEVRFTEFGTWHGRAILEEMQVRHLLPSERGKLTTVRYLSYEERKLDPATFDPEGARLVP